MADYSVYSKFYDQLEGSQETKAAFIKQLIGEFAPNAKSLLEIACGTGNVLEHLQEYKLAGLDFSQGMLDVARAKLPNVDFTQQDMRSFHLESTFDIILCIYDSINHLATLDDWEQTFKSVHAHLNAGGIFIFDMNTLPRLQKLASADAGVRQFGENHLLMKVFQEENKFKWNVKVFEKQASGDYKLHEEDIYETSYVLEEVKARLGMFEIVKVCGQNGMDVTDDSARVFFVCRKV